jgi:hypothetical protein
VTPATWPCPLPGGTAHEYALTFDGGRQRRLLIVPALFDEANRMRRLTVEVMRRLDRAGIDCFLPDLPGCNESLQPLDRQTPESWRAAMEDAATHFAATHVLAIRGGALVAPTGLPAWHYAPVKGASILRQQIRARIVTAREAGTGETQDDLLEKARTEGIELSGHRLCAEFVRQLQALTPVPGAQDIAQALIGGGGLWLRAEPDEDRAQADALAAVLAIGITA